MIKSAFGSQDDLAMKRDYNPLLHMDKLIDGKKLAQIREHRLRTELERLNKRPKIVSILIGDDPASVLYTTVKQKKAAEVGIDFDYVKFDSGEQFENVSMTVLKLNQDPTVDAVMIQLPLPKQFLRDRLARDLLERIDPRKDVDGLTDASPFLPASVRAVMSILADEQVALSGKFIVVVGVSGAVGRALAKELKAKKTMVSGIDEHTADIAKVTKRADILISAVGKPNLIRAEMVKEGVVVIDVGITRMKNGMVMGDVDFRSVCQKASKITPVPGGVGPMTVVSLMENVVESAK